MREGIGNKNGNLSPGKGMTDTTTENATFSATSLRDGNYFSSKQFLCASVQTSVFEQLELNL